MSGSIKQARKGLRPHKGSKSTVQGPQKGSQGRAIGTDTKHTPAEPWLKK
jgi:hypothetical protein